MRISKPDMHFGASPATMRAAARLRKNMTLGEYLLWKKLRDRKLFSSKFRKQHPVNIFIVDFYCHECKLVIEVDGEIHNSEAQTEYDVSRTAKLSILGLKVIRFTNHEIINEIDLVLSKIRDAITEDTPLPGGRGATSAE